MGTLLMWQCKIITYSLRGQAEGCVKWGNTHVHVFIHPASLCLFFGAFNPFLFKVMVDMYVFITIFLIVLGLFSVGLFFLLCFLSREVPLAYAVELVWWCWILLTFACLKSFWFLHQIWRVLLGRVFLVVGSSLSSLQVYHAIPFWLVEFLLRNQLIAWWEFPCILFVVFPSLLLIFYLCLFVCLFSLGFSGGSEVKASASNAGDLG